MDVYEGYVIAQKILRKSGGSRNPDEICRCLGIDLEDGYDLVNLKGMYTSANGHRTIFLHRRLEGYLRRFVLAHEIAHDQIPEHRKRARSNPYQFYGVEINNTEREANSVAAHLLIDDEEMVELIMEGKTASAIAAELGVPEDLLLIEVEDFSKVHPEMMLRVPRTGRGDYLKDYEDGQPEE